jgi:hypothetical protein
MGWPSLFKKFKGAEDNAVIHLESLLDHEKLKNQEGQQVYHKNEKVYLAKISKLESEKMSKDKQANDFKSK